MRSHGSHKRRAWVEKREGEARKEYMFRAAKQLSASLLFSSLYPPAVSQVQKISGFRKLGLHNIVFLRDTFLHETLCIGKDFLDAFMVTVKLFLVAWRYALGK